jgi:hypothetical protein
VEGDITLEAGTDNSPNPQSGGGGGGFGEDDDDNEDVSNTIFLNLSQHPSGSSSIFVMFQNYLEFSVVSFNRIQGVTI